MSASYWQITDILEPAMKLSIRFRILDVARELFDPVVIRLFWTNNKNVPSQNIMKFIILRYLCDRENVTVL